MKKSKDINLINPKYQFPDYYSWPFFFTLQKHGETKRKQLQMWIDLTVKFCQDNKVWRLSKSEFYENLGKNYKINRKVNHEFVDVIFENLVKANKAKFVNENNKDEIYVLWKTLNEWQQFIYTSAVNKGSIDQLETLDYISTDDDNKHEEFYNIDRDLLITILKDLEKQGKCGLIQNDDRTYVAVKFIKK